jgi:hypothetical protein
MHYGTVRRQYDVMRAYIRVVVVIDPGADTQKEWFTHRLHVRGTHYGVRRKTGAAYHHDYIKVFGMSVVPLWCV